MKLDKLMILVVATLGLAACETTQNSLVDKTADGEVLLTELGAPATPLEPMSMPKLMKVGEKRSFFRQGAELDIVVLEANQGTITKQISSGCQYTDAVVPNNLPSFSPSLSWQDCRGSAGHAKVTVKGELFPLEVGKKVVYSVAGTSTKGSWTGDWQDRRVCEVADQVRIRTISGEYDTWKVKCTDKNNTHVNYISPELGFVVAQKRKHATSKARTYTMIYIPKG